MHKAKNNTLLFLLILIGAFLRFYNLNWGAPFYFHPDERNIASSVAQLTFPTQMNPHFFAYGSLPIYMIYFTGYLMHFFQRSQVLFEEAIVISRFYSTLFATLLIPILFLIGKKLKNEKLGLLAAFFATTSVGFIQFAHFGTFEMWLTFFGTLLFWTCINIHEKKNSYAIFFSGIIMGILIAVKISSVILLLLPFLAVSLNKNKLFKKLLNIISLLLISCLVYIATNPFIVLDQNSFISSMKYESGVVAGSLPVFYTGGFYNTAPILFQFTKIYPFLLNPIITLIFLPALIYLIYKGIKTKNKSYLTLTTFYLILFVPQAFLFAKWTRYMVPTLPFVYLIISIAIIDFLQRFRKIFGIKYLIISIFIFVNVLFGISYFVTAFAKPDTRVTAARFAQNNIQTDSKIISEPYDLGLIAFRNPNITIVNFYDMDTNNTKYDNEKLSMELKQASYIILLSQRIMRSRLLNKTTFPKGFAFYANLTNGSLGFEKIYETPCDIFCKITYLNNPIFAFEETASVFDRPIVMIFKKLK